LIDLISNELLKSAELTGQWERKLRLIEKGQYDLETFKNELNIMVRTLVDEVIFSSNSNYIQLNTEPEVTVAKPKVKAEKQAIEGMTCPKCKAHELAKGKTAYGCSNFKACGFKMPFELLGKKLTDKQVLDLLTKGKTTKIKALQMPGSNLTIDGVLGFDTDFNITIL